MEAMEIVWLSLTAASLTLTISKGKIFRNPRNRLTMLNSWLGELINCPYCTSHWISLLLVAIFRPRPLVSEIMIIDLAVSMFILVSLSSMLIGLIYKSISMVSTDEEEKQLRLALKEAQQMILELQKG